METPPPWEQGEDVGYAGYPGPDAGHSGVDPDGSAGSGAGDGASGGGVTSGGGDSARPRRRPLTVALVITLGLAAIAGGGVAIGANMGGTPRAGNPGTTTVTGGSSPLPKSVNVSAIAARVEPAIVDITAILPGGGRDAGTGMIISPSGEVLTNNHVIFSATRVVAQIDGKGTVYQVRVLGVDPSQDIALIQLEHASGLPVVQLGSSARLKLGDPVIAIGNALALTGPPTVTTGIVSALNRSITASDGSGGLVEHLHGLIQTDAPINPGNSGGPLINGAGRVIGITTANATGSSSQTASNIGFAIPIATAAAIAAQILRGQASATVKIGERGFIGVEVNTIRDAQSFLGSGYSAPVSSGAVVTEVIAGTPAARKGITIGDVITEFDDDVVSSPLTLHNAVMSLQPEVVTSITWFDTSGRRHHAEITLTLKPIE